MKIAMINLGNFGSTGTIMLGIDQIARARGHKTCVCYPNSRTNKKKRLKNEILIGTRLGRNLHIALGTMLGRHGMFSLLDTYLFLKKLDQFAPDLIHLHNIHGFFINLPMLFRYIKKRKIKVVWTLHDCWAFTGHCPYFTMVKCEKWKQGCSHCPQYQIYPASKIDRSKSMWKLKREWFTGIEDLTIVTPSKWLEALVKESFLREYSIRVINNGLNLKIFKPFNSDFRVKYGVKDDEFMVLFVSFGWGRRKGLDVIERLYACLDQSYRIVVVGTDETIDQILPAQIISIHNTQNQLELASIYTAADVFVNPTREEVLGMVNLEALACGTPVVTFQTGGSPECVEENCGIVVACDDLPALKTAIEDVCSKKRLADSFQPCIERAARFDQQLKFQEYMTLYEEQL